MTLMAFSSCALTRNLAEDDILYRGIDKLEYGEVLKQDTTQTKGVITAINDAYTAVEDLFSGDATKLTQLTQTESERKDSLKRMSKQDKLNFIAAQEEVSAVVSYAPNGALMGSSYHTHPFPFRLWVYGRYLHSQRRFGKWMFKSFSANPVLLSNVNPQMRSAVAQNTMRNYGYFRSKVSYDTVFMKKPQLAKVSYYVTPGELFHFDRIEYQYFPTQADSIINSIKRRTHLISGNPFNVKSLDNERNRLSDAFRNNGYFYFRPEYIHFRADTLISPGNVQLQVRPSQEAPFQAMHPYYLGKTTFTIYNEEGYTTNLDSIGFRGFRYRYDASNKKRPIKLKSIRKYFLYRRGDLYRQDIENIMQQMFLSTNVFRNIQFSYVPRAESSLKDSLSFAHYSADRDTLDVHITATLDKPYDAEFQGRIAGKSNGQVGPGVNFSMRKYNAFRGAETLQFQAWGSYEWQTGANLPAGHSLLNSYEYGTELSLAYPRWMFFGLGKRINRRFFSTTSFAINARWLNRAGYFGRVSFGGHVTYTLQRNRYVKHELSLFQLNYDQLLSHTARFDSIVNENQALYITMRDQFIPSMEYTYSWKNRSHHARTWRITLKEAGNFLSAGYALGGRSFSERNKSFLTVPFAQYLKGTVEYTHHFPVTRRSILAARVFGGFLYSYGNSKLGPYSDLFSVGGANSIRAFSVRSIGPGRYHPAGSYYSYIDQMGDLKLEANLEYRFPIVSKLNGAIFLDAGNVWLLKHNEQQPGGQFNFKDFGKDIALGTGAGLRYDLDFLVIRFDVGVGLHIPYDTGKSGYYNIPKFKRSLGYHFAIGYPF